YEVGEHQGRPFFSLEFCEGGSLADRLRGGPLDPDLAALVLERVADAMHAAHQAGVVHRDLKPENILLSHPADPSEDPTVRRPGDKSGGTSRGRPDTHTPEFLHSWTPKVADFGLAKRLDLADDRTRSGDVLGTPSYMAPEQAAGKVKEVGPWTD